MKEQGHATAGGEEVGGDRGTREEEPASRAPPPGPDLQDHSEPPQPNPQPERDAQRQEKREHSAGEGRIPESEGEGEFITQKKKKKIKNINEINSPESEGKAEQGSETLETQAGTVGDPAQPDSQPQQQQQPPPTAEERADAGLEEDETSCGEGGDLDEGDISDSSLFSDIPDSQTNNSGWIFYFKCERQEIVVLLWNLSSGSMVRCGSSISSSSSSLAPELSSGNCHAPLWLRSSAQGTVTLRSGSRPLSWLQGSTPARTHMTDACHKPFLRFWFSQYANEHPHQVSPHFKIKCEYEPGSSPGGLFLQVETQPWLERRPGLEETSLLSCTRTTRLTYQTEAQSDPG
ncbi:UNVERIFIED_CONTAM: hypothetical protein FKN15_047673 [Acipenser sinensis]